MTHHSELREHLRLVSHWGERRPDCPVCDQLFRAAEAEWREANAIHIPPEFEEVPVPMDRHQGIMR